MLKESKETSKVDTPVTKRIQFIFIRSRSCCHPYRYQDKPVSSEF